MPLFGAASESFTDMNHELALLRKQIDWPAVKPDFAGLVPAERKPCMHGRKAATGTELHINPAYIMV